MSIEDWTNPAEFDAFREANATGFIFKHSTRCPVSFEAQREVERFAESGAEIPIYRVLVVENRATSSAIADRLGVAHASPQVILVAGGEPAWHASHWDVTAATLQGAWDRAGVS